MKVKGIIYHTWDDFFFSPLPFLAVINDYNGSTNEKEFAIIIYWLIFGVEFSLKRKRK